MGFPGGSIVKNPPANAGDTGNMGLIPGSGRSTGGGNGKPFQYSCLENPMDRGSQEGQLLFLIFIKHIHSTCLLLFSC